MPVPHPVFELADRFVDRLSAAVPLWATFLGVAGHDHEWGDLSAEGIAELATVLYETRAALAELPPPETPDDVLAVRVLQDVLDLELDTVEHDDLLRDVSHLTATPVLMRDVLEVQDTATQAGREALLARLRTFPEALHGWRRRLETALECDVLAAQRQVHSVAAQLRASAGDDGAFVRRVEALAAVAPDLGGAARDALPAMRRAADEAADFLEAEYLPHAPVRDAAGEERYRRLARQHLGTDLDPQEAYAWAWEQLDELLARAAVVAARIDPDVGLDDVLERLRSDPAYAAPDPESFRRRMVQRQEDALARLAGTHFEVPAAIRRVEVKLAPPGAPLGASYVGPSEDLTRPGSIWWSLGERQLIPLFEEVSTAYHEGFPGHHLQIGLQVTLTERLSRAHRLLGGTTGYVEGWALYAETLMDELGLLERPEYELGYLTSSLLRVVRVLVDLGLHLELTIPERAPFHPGEPWSFDLAVEALQQLAALDRDYAISEVTRYLGWPGQAIAYALGQRTIKRLREERRRREGDAFDLTAFHADVLGSGSVGLDHLADLVLAAGGDGAWPDGDATGGAGAER